MLGFSSTKSQPFSELRFEKLKSFQTERRLHFRMQRLSESDVPTVLVVEDDDQVRALLRSLLTHDGYRVIEATTGEEGLRVAMENDIHLLLSDMLLPELSGFDLAEKLLKRRPDLKILFITGYVEGEIVQRSMNELGAQFLDKPFQPSALLERVRGSIGHAKRASNGT